MMTLADKRRSIRHLLDERAPAAAMAVYFAFYHPDDKTQLYTYPSGSDRADGYVALSRTGIDLFRPLVTWRLPPADVGASADLIHQALAPGAPVILNTAERYFPLAQALFDIQTEEHLRLFVLDPRRFEPIINVLVTQDSSPNNLPRFVVRPTQIGRTEVAAASVLNWQSPYFAEISVHTDPKYRRRGWGQSVVAAMVQYLLDNGRIPLYAAAEQNAASIQLAQRVGFVDSGVREVVIQGTLKPPP
ncbi:MAG TPA: GNAT family N-acetyltransferase [Anaerolineae bacterium]